MIRKAALGSLLLLSVVCVLLADSAEIVGPDGKPLFPVRRPAAICLTDCDIGNPKPQRGYGGAVWLPNAWEPGQTLVVQFMDRHDDGRLHQMVESHVRQWERHVNLRFVFLPAGDTPQQHGFHQAHIRITFNGRGHHSAIGTDSITAHAQNQPSMSLQLTSATPQEEIRRVVLHEFGHALGFVHEHQSPQGGIRWKQPQAMEYYKRTLGWDEKKIRQNIFDRLDGPEIAASAFDRDSIMLYPIPRGLTTDGFSAGWNMCLSITDVRVAADIYPAKKDLRLGASVRIAPGYMKRGVMICDLRRRSPFRNMRRLGGGHWHLDPGDVITAIDGAPIRSVEDYLTATNKLNQDHFSVKSIDIHKGWEVDAIR